MARTTIEVSLKELEDWDLQRLHRSAERVVRTERRHVAWLIAHLAEISRRKAHLELGYPGLFAYCTQYLGLSEGSAHLRVQVANVCRRFPVLLEYLADNRISVTVAGHLARHLDEDSAHGLLARCERKTKREVLEILSPLDPKPPVSSGISRKPEPKDAAPGGTNTATSERSLDSEASEPAVSPLVGDPEVAPSARPPGPVSPSRPASVEPARAEVYNFRFSADREFKQKLERLAEVLGVPGASRNMSTVLEKALDIALDQRDPQRKQERRRASSAAAPRPDEAESVENEAVAPPTSRSIPSAVRGFVLERAGHQCEFEGPDGVRCSERTGIEVDHIQPFARGGTHHESNLRVLCRAHNRLCAERVFGAEFIREKIIRARLARSG